MARRSDKLKAIELRKQGYSYTQIQQELGVGKSTLSGWLAEMPLTKARLHELQRNNLVIEKIRATKRKKREARLTEVFGSVANDIGTLSDREFLIAGLFLYWAEGGKTRRYATVFSNTDPNMIRFYLKWLSVLGVPKEKISFRLHLYLDMDIEKEISFWSRIVNFPRTSFRNPYIKQSKSSAISFKTFGHGTCNVTVYGRDLSEYVLQGIRYISEMY